MVWIAVVGYIHRTQQVLFGMDTMMNILLFYLMVGNSGRGAVSGSLDRTLLRGAGELRRTGTIDPATRAFLNAPPPSRAAGFGTRLIQVHFCFIYIAAGLSKLKGAAWWNGTATWDVFVNPEFTLMQYEWYEKIASRAGERRAVLLHDDYRRGVVHAVYRNRRAVLALDAGALAHHLPLASLMHAIIAVMMGLNLFELLMIVMVLAFMPDGVIRDRFRRCGEPVEAHVYVQSASAVSSRAAGAGRGGGCGIAGDVRIRPDADADSDRRGGEEANRPDRCGRVIQVGAIIRVVGFRVVAAGVKGFFTRLAFPHPRANPPSAPPPTPPASKPPTPAAAS